MRNEQEENNVLYIESDRIRRENIAIQGVLNGMICPSCSRPSGEEDTEQIREKLQRENLELRQEIERVSNILANHMGRPLLEAVSNQADVSPAGQGSGSPDFEIGSLVHKINFDKSVVIAENAMHELIKLLGSNNPLWIRSPIDECHVLDCHSYVKIIPKSMGPRFLKSRVESSKHSGLVNMEARELVDLYLDSDEWVHHFPVAVSKTRTMHVLEPGCSGTRNGFFQLIYEQIHVLSPLTRPQEFYLLRYCRQIETGVWVIADVSLDLRGRCCVPPTSCWKHPSGCMIEHLYNGLSKVTYVEHLEIDDGFIVHPVHEELVKSSFRFGAKRWIMTLQRTCDQYFYLSESGRLGHQHGRVLAVAGRSMAMLAKRIVGSFCSIFSFLATVDVRQLSELTRDGVQIAIRKSISPGHPAGTVIVAASSFWVPASPERVSKYLSDYRLRSQWDALFHGDDVCEIMRLSTGIDTENHLSILQALNPSANIVFQEFTIEQSGSLIVYAPIHASIASELIMGKDPTNIQILASGFVVNGVVLSQKPSASTSSGGSYVTLGFQFLACSSLYMDNEVLGMVPKARGFVNETVSLIKSAFDS